MYLHIEAIQRLFKKYGINFYIYLLYLHKVLQIVEHITCTVFQEPQKSSVCPSILIISHSYVPIFYLMPVVILVSYTRKGCLICKLLQTIAPGTDESFRQSIRDLQIARLCTEVYIIYQFNHMILLVETVKKTWAILSILGTEVQLTKVDVDFLFNF